MSKYTPQREAQSGGTCHVCGYMAASYCDHQYPDGSYCNKPLCFEHAKNPEPGVHLCEEHSK
jgi:hypothetical protein